MRLRRCDLILVAGLAAFVGGNGQALAEDGQYSSATVNVSGAAPGITAGMRTSDIRAKYVYCYLSGTQTTCSVGNTNSSYPKNIGNLLCLPAANSNYQLTANCQTLLAQQSGCQKNSASGKCISKDKAVMPYCNYRTTSDKGTTASWTWTVTLPATGSTVSIDCQYSGYTSVSP